MPNFRLGTEMADRARFWGRVGGIFHTDELPTYGITAEEIEEVKKTTKAKEQDAIVFVSDSPENDRDALKAVTERAREAINGVPEETRAPNPDGTTRYMRPRPGAARMYPETDIPLTHITEDNIKKISSRLPELPEQKLGRLMKEYRLNQKLARQIIDSENSELFETIVKESSVSPTTVAAFLTETLRALKRDSVEVDKVSENQIREIFKSISAGKLTKEAVSDVVVWLSQHEDKSVEEAINNLGLKIVSESELKTFIEKVIADNEKLIKERGESSVGILMGIVMKSMRGKIDVVLASKVLKEKLREFLN
jgi:glutamyl-tRNA(Gln) amidotransferase subunit E